MVEMCRTVGFSPSIAKKLSNSMARIARVCSFKLWCARHNKAFDFHPIHAISTDATRWSIAKSWLKAQRYMIGDTEWGVDGRATITTEPEHEPIQMCKVESAMRGGRNSRATTVRFTGVDTITIIPNRFAPPVL